ncbi:MAG: GIY-YIG nuclease family protein [candidate division Zixibacteria bacterium]|nr:GIY-YIG nuclease family protein [candidate division Zixibacteria bacterium]
MKTAYIYIMSNWTNTVVYTGVTTDLKKRVYQHRNKSLPGFTRRYNVKKLVYFEMCESIINAIAREKQIKSWSRRKKDELIKTMNRPRRDLYDEI